MAECFWPGVTAELVEAAGDRVRHAAAATNSDGRLARYLSSILVPSDEIAFCLFEAASPVAALELIELAALPSERVLEVVWLESR